MNSNSLTVAKLPLARIPWIKTKTCENARLEDTKFYKKYMSNDKADKAHLNLVLYKFLDEVFPYYLPKRYHTMDVVALEEMSSSTDVAEDFASSNATYFFFKSCVYNDLGWTIFHHLCETPAYTDEDGVHLMNSKLKAAFFQKGVPPEQSGSAAEFILEPWVLSQLLFQPAILHQWVMAVYAEGLQLHAETAALEHLPYRPELGITKSVRYILKRLASLDTCVMWGLMVLEKSCGTQIIFRQKNVMRFFNLVLDLLPFLKLLLGKKVSHIIRAAKRMHWNGSVINPVGDMKQRFVPSFKFYNVMYSFKYWHKENFDYYFVGEKLQEYELLPMAGGSDSCPAVVAWTEKIRKKFGSLAKWDKIKNFINQEILKTGWIRGVDAEDALKLVEGDMMILYHYLIYMKYKGMSSFAPGIRISDTGMLQVIRTLQADSELANALAAITVRFFILLVKKHPVNARLQAVNCEGPDVSKKEILSTVSLMKAKWTISKLMKLLRDQIPSETGKAADEQCPNMDTIAVPDIVSGLEDRIKKVMFGIIKTFFESLSTNQPKVCYEAAFIQYVLPTFVVSFLRSTKNPEATLGDQKRHLSFVHHLIKTFENPKGLITPLSYRSNVSARPKKTTFNYVFRHFADKELEADLRVFLGINCGLVKFKHIEIKNELLRPYDETGRVPPLLIKSFLHFNAGLIDILATKRVIHSDAVEDGSCLLIPSPIYQIWTSWMSRYLTRIQFALQKAYHGTETTPVHHRWSQCLTFYDLLMDFTDIVTWEPVSVLVDSLFMYRMYVMDIVGIKGHLRLGRHTFFHGGTECEVKKLSVQQMFAIMFYHAIKLNNGFSNLALTEVGKLTVMPPFHLDKIEIALHSILLKDKWRLKQVISEWLSDADGKTDLSLTTFEDVQAAPLCYKLTEQDVTQDGKVKMIYPGEITFFPIKHCRWCGLVDNGKKEMKICKECLQSPEYPDKNFFCSQKCEDVAMDILHREEHARYLMIQLDMID